MKTRKIPMRKCVGCAESKDKKELIRILKTPENEVVLDLTGRKNGRGAYICNDIKCFEKACKSKAISRSLECEISEETVLKIAEEINKNAKVQ